MQANVQERFFAWLSTRVSSVQLSEYYMACKDIEAFCLSRYILTKPLFETTDTAIIQGIIDTIKSNQMFQSKYFRQLRKMRKAMDDYMMFLQEVINPIEKNSIGVATSKDIEKDKCTLEKVFIWNFANDRLEFSNKIPIAIAYFGDKIKVQGWKEAFVEIVKSMQEDYPSIIRGMVGYRFHDAGKVALAGMSGIRKFRKAAELKGGLYLETDCSPNEMVSIIRVLMDKCNMDYDNLEMFYVVSEKKEIEEKNQEENIRVEYDESVSDEKNKTIDERGINEQQSNTSIDESGRKIIITSVAEGKAIFADWLTTDVGLAVRSAQSYTSAINVASQYSVRLGFSDKELFFILDVDQVYQISKKLFANPDFVQMNDSQHNRYHAALSKYLDYCKAIAGKATAKNGARADSVSATAVPVEKAEQKTVVPTYDFSVDPQVQKRYSAILTENFVDGFRPEKTIDRNRFRMHYSDMFGEELAEEDEMLVHTLMKVGTLRDGRIFVEDETKQKDLLEEINDTIMKTFEDGASCIYLDCLFARYQEQLAESLRIYNVDSLERILFDSGKRNYFKRYNYLFGYDKEPAPNRDIIEYMKKSHLPVTYSEIGNDLWYIPLDKIKITLVTTQGIVNVASESYLYAPNLPVSEREIQQIVELITHSLLQRSYISDVELIHLIEEECPSVIMNTSDYPMWGLRNALAYLLREKFSFRGAIISDKDEEISMSEVFSDFCHRSEHITVDKLKQLASELNTVIYWDSVYSEMVRVNQNEFIRRDQIHFDIEQTDSVLERLIQTDYAPIKTIDLFLHFPAIDVSWNSFVLESYVANYSKKFRLIHTDYTVTDCCGAVVRQESGITDYRTLIVDVLKKNIGWKNKNDALQLLVDLGYQQRRSYSDIEKVMQEAKANRKI